MCFVCGMKNGLGLKSFFYETANNELIGSFKPCEEHQGYPGMVHGGVISAILDEAMFRAILIGKDEEIWAVTIELNIKYKKPVPLNKEIRTAARIINETNRTFDASGEVYLAGGELAATASGKYFKVASDKLDDLNLEELEWRVYNNDDDPKEIEIKD